MKTKDEIKRKISDIREQSEHITSAKNKGEINFEEYKEQNVDLFVEINTLLWVLDGTP